MSRIRLPFYCRGQAVFLKLSAHRVFVTKTLTAFGAILNILILSTKFGRRFGPMLNRGA